MQEGTKAGTHGKAGVFDYAEHKIRIFGGPEFPSVERKEARQNYEHPSIHV
jgi:hypothetical protein